MGRKMAAVVGLPGNTDNFSMEREEEEANNHYRRSRYCTSRYTAASIHGSLVCGWQNYMGSCWVINSRVPIWCIKVISNGP